ncbi:universal stress protein [Zavarzinia sp. CC-PAN008]|uniref:universal stress protein n=1 Tax=Zavarzinia sp. CC-PAN008 TaxID=3243332 RepID=UPI003F74A76A
MEGPLTDQAESGTGPGATGDDAHRRKFLVIVDGTPECRVALRYATRRALHTNGIVSLLYVIEPAGLQHWRGVEEIMREEARDEAESVLHDMAREVNRIAGLTPELVIREGKRREQLISLLEEDPEISILVLAAGTGKEGPGPLVSALAGQMSGSFRVPITVVPGSLSDGQIDALT